MVYSFATMPMWLTAAPAKVSVGEARDAVRYEVGGQ